MKYAIISDTHFGVKNDNIFFQAYQKRCIEEFLLPILKRNNIKEIIHLGDFFDRRKYINFQTLNFVYDIIKSLSEYKIHILLGNHDIYFRNTNEVNSPKLVLKQFKNVEIYENAIEFNKNILFLPWLTEENEKQAFELIEKTSCPIVMGHLEIKGFQTGPNSFSENGLDRNIFDKFLMVLSGHFHLRQIQNNIYYIGNLWDLIQTDSDLEKGFHIFDDETGELQFHSIPLKIFKKIVFDDSNAKTVNDVLLSQDILHYISGCYLQVYVKQKTNQIFFEKFLEQINNANCANIIIDDASNNLILNDEGLGVKDASLNTIMDFIKGAVHKIEFGLQEEQKKSLEKLMIKLYTQAEKE